MKISITNRCEICHKPKGRFFNHDACSKIKQAQHAQDKRPYTEAHLDKGSQAYLSKTGEPS